MKKVGLYSPFMSENIGGGERYLLTVAECALTNNCNVDLIIQSNIFNSAKEKEKLKQKFTNNFKLDLNNLNIINGPFGKKTSAISLYNFTKKYDSFYYMTDGSFFIPGSKNSAIHFMIPFKNPTGSKLNQLKLKFWKTKTSNAIFTKNIIEKNWKTKINYVHWGAVSKKDFKPLKKQNIILNVGRFFSNSGSKHCKRQDILVEIFKKMCDKGLKNWQLILLGTIDIGKDNEEYAQKVAQMAKDYPIKIVHKSTFKDLQNYYGHASIYWHATGYGLNEFEFPTKMEHLGLSTIESMAAGCVPVVIKKAGQRETVKDGENGLMWETQEECIEKTLSLINNQKLMKKLSVNAIDRSENFSKENFYKMTKKILNI